MLSAAWKMILIEDNPDDRADLRQMLLQGSSRRYTFVEAETGQAGVRACREANGQPPDFILLDFHLPDMDALEVLAEIRAGRDWAPCPVVVLTGSSDFGVGREVLRAGAQDFIGKSWTTPQSLVRAMENAAERFALLTERREVQNRLRQSEERFRALAEASFEGILFSDHGQIVDCNEQLAALLGYRREELLGRSVVEFLPPDQHELARQAVQAGRATSLEVPIRHRDGTWRVVEVRGRPLAERPGLRVAVIHDITERKHTEDRLREAKEELARANTGLEQTVQERTAKLRDMVAELEHMSYSIVHDLRAPLRAIQSYATFIEQVEGSRLALESRDYLERMKESTQRMDNLITDALNYNQAVRSELPVSSVDVAQLLQDMLRPHPQFEPVRVEIRLAGDFPRVRGNASGLTQCFSELLGNAIKFVRPGRRPEVRVWAEILAPQGEAGGQEGVDVSQPSSPRVVRLWFEDQGTGIPKNGQKRIFDMFQRMHGPEYAGTGIGLALVRKVMERMGGRVGVESEPDHGSRFWLELPLG
ncbi:MAG TPA: PAS domain S-box protein [Candidatus Sulfotelmatobacter sp.]|nr:PAS domain S-box protein [Candidatus Sulfotelmatobacter sp.]